MRLDVTSAANLAVQRSAERPVRSEEPLRLGCFGVSDPPAARLHYEVCYSWSNEEQTQTRSQLLHSFTQEAMLAAETAGSQRVCAR